jgi:Holliday junction resolvase
MSSKNNEAKLWQKVKKGLTDCFLTRIESSTINGIPDIHAVHKQEVFWIELKSDSLSYPALNKWQVVWINKYVKAGGKVIILKENLGKTPLQSVLKLYRPVSLFTEPRSLVPRSSFSAPYNWTLVQQQVLRELGSMHSSA